MDGGEEMEPSMGTTGMVRGKKKRKALFRAFLLWV
jgi:hypothetical protein